MADIQKINVVGTDYTLKARALTTSAGSTTTPVYFKDGIPTALGYTIAKSVPSNAVFTDHIYSNMTAATASAAGKAGLVPAPAAGKQDKFLRGDGTWTTQTITSMQSGAAKLSVSSSNNNPQITGTCTSYSMSASGSATIDAVSVILKAGIKSGSGGVNIQGTSGITISQTNTSTGGITIESQAGTMNLKSAKTIDLKAETAVRMPYATILKSYPSSSTSTTFNIVGIYDTGNRWGDSNFPTYISGATVQINGKNPAYQSTSSDRNLKEEITPLTAQYDEMFDKLTPVTYKYNNGESGRTHIGLIAQDVEEAIKDSNLDNMSCAAVDIVPFENEEIETIYDKETDSLVKNPKSNKNTLLELGYNQEYCLNYNEFIGLLIYETQQLKKKNKELENRLATLEG